MLLRTGHSPALAQHSRMSSWLFPSQLLLGRLQRGQGPTMARERGNGAPSSSPAPAPAPA